MAQPVPASTYNFAAVPIEVKRSWVEGVPGATVVHGEASRFTTLGENASSANDDLTRHLNGLQVDWRGPASEASQAQLRAVGAGMDATSSVTGNGSQRLNDYGDSFSTMASQIVYDDPAKAGWLGFLRSDGWQAALGVLDSRLSFSQANQQNSAQADHALTVHAANTADVVSRFGTDTGPGVRWPGDAGSGAGQGGGSAAPSSGAGPGDGTATGSTPGGAGPGAGGAPGVGVGGGSGSSPLATAPARFEPPSSQAAGPQPGAPNVSAPGTAASPPAGTALPGAHPPGGSSSGARPPVGQAGVPQRSGPQASAPRADRGDLSGTDRAARFQDGLRNRQMPVPGSFGAGHGAGAPGDGRGSYGRGGAGGWGGTGPRGGAGAWNGTGGGSGTGAGSGAGGSGSGGWRGLTGANPGSGQLQEGGSTGARGSGARPGFGERGVGGYGPMVGGAGAGSAGDQEHRNRYLVPSDEVFAVPLVATDPVLGPDEDDRR